MTRHRNLLALLASSFILLGMSFGAAAPPNEETVKGTVVRAGDAMLTLVASSSGTIHKFDVAADATISRDGRNAKLEEVALGDFALVSVKDHGDAPIATIIVAISPFKVDGEHR